MVFHWSLSDSKFRQVSRILLSFLADLSSSVLWMVSARPPISDTSSSLGTPLEIVPRTPIIISINVTLMIHNSFSSLARSLYLSFFVFFDFNSVVHKDGKTHNLTRSFFFFFSLIITRSNLLAGIR